MTGSGMQKGTVFHTTKLLIKAFHRSEANGWKLALPAILAVLASLCEGFSLALLLPLIQLLLTLAGGSTAALTTQVPEWLKAWLPSSDRSMVAILLSLVLIASLLKVTLSYFSSLLAAFQVKQFAHRLRILLYERYLGFGKLFFDKNSLGQQQQILTTYVSVISLTLSSFQMALYALCTTAVYFVILFSLSWPLTLAVLFVFPILHVSLKKLIDRIGETSSVYTQAYNELGKKIVNALSAVPLIKSYCSEADELSRFNYLSGQVAAYEYSIEKKNLLVGPVQEFILVCFLVLFAGLIGAVEASGAQGSFAEYVVFLLVLKRAATLFGVFNTLRSSVASISGPFEEMMKLLNDEDKYPVPNGTRRFNELTQAIRLNNLTFSFPNGTPALSGLTMNITRGSVTGIVGESGAGKSTIINLLMRFYDPPAGSITVDSTDLREFTLDSWRAKCALVSQEAHLFHGTIKENLIYGIKRDVSQEDIEMALTSAQLSQFIASLPNGIESMIGERGLQLSGGQRQRLSIARAFLKRAEILLFDEAVSALDSMTEREVHRALEQLVRGRTAIIVAHRLSSVRFADHIIVLEKGRLIEQGSIESLLHRQGRFFEYWTEQGMQRA